MSAIGPIARSAADLRAGLIAVAGPEAPADRAYSWRLAPPRHRTLRDFRVGVVLDDPACPVTSDVGRALSDTAEALARAGVTIRTGWPQGIDPERVAESFGAHLNAFFAFHGDGGLDGVDLVSHEGVRMSARAAWADYFADIDVFLCPTNFTAAFPHDDRQFEARTVLTPEGERPYGEQPFWITHASLPGLPALAAPVGLAGNSTSNSLPVGVQILGPMHEDDTVITFAELLADLVGGYAAPRGGA
jgi:amidase